MDTCIGSVGRNVKLCDKENEKLIIIFLYLVSQLTSTTQLHRQTPQTAAMSVDYSIIYEFSKHTRIPVTYSVMG